MSHLLAKTKIQSLPESILNASELEEYLDQFLDPVLSFRRSAAGPAEAIAQLAKKEQQFSLHWVKIIAATNAEFAYQYAASVAAAIVSLQQDIQAIELWTIEAMSAYDERGLQLACKVLQNHQSWAEDYFKQQQGILLDDVNKLLTTFVCGLNGRDLKIEVLGSQDNAVYSDTESIFLPKMISEYSSKDNNFIFYKLLVVYQWAQNYFGTWHYDLSEQMSQYHDSKLALNLFHSFESIRLLYKIKKELPGFFRQAQTYLKPFYRLQEDPQWSSIYLQLAKESANAQISLDLLAIHYQQVKAIEFTFQGILIPEKVDAVKQRRLLLEKNLFREALAQIAQEKLSHEDDESSDVLETDQDESLFQYQSQNEEELLENSRYELFLDGESIIPADNVQSLMSSIIQDIGEIPEEYLVAAGPGQYIKDNNAQDKKTDDVWSGVYHEEGAYFYDEWDYIRQHYKKNWCVVRELKVTPVIDDFVSKTLSNNRSIVKSLRRHFEALKGEEKLLKQQINGDDIDLDALVESYAEMTTGMEMSEYVFTKMQREDRNIAVMFLVDMSGSTKGWINQAERESLVLLCESLEMLGDRYAIYGFSGTTRKRCEIYHIKHLHEDYNDKVKARISGVSAKDYTRMGFAIRHLTALLEDVEAKSKLLITLSDGKPEDYDGLYRGEYGIEDTRQSLFEARQKGIHPYCITIDKTAGDYLPHMYGAANYVLIEDINKLPIKVADIYRKLTT